MIQLKHTTNGRITYQFDVSYRPRLSYPEADTSSPRLIETYHLHLQDPELHSLHLLLDRLVLCCFSFSRDNLACDLIKRRRRRLSIHCEWPKHFDRLHRLTVVSRARQSISLEWRHPHPLSRMREKQRTHLCWQTPRMATVTRLPLLPDLSEPGGG